MFDTSLYRGSLTLLRTTPIINWTPIQRCILMLFMACGALDLVNVEADCHL